jgi:RimJ/RimL family protein N-acetyltransferase
VKRIVSDEERVEHFVRRFVPGQSAPGFRTLGLERDGEIVAGIIYENFNDSNVFCHIAAEPGGHSMTRGFIEAIFGYPFQQLHLRRMTAYVKASNLCVQRFMKHLGFVLEAELSEAGDNGETMRIYVMKKEWCRYGHAV